jgi:hypothetical protein
MNRVVRRRKRPANERHHPASQIEEIVTEPEKTEEIDPLTLIASLERDVSIAKAALRKIHDMKLSKFAGGPSNQMHGRRFQQAYEDCQQIAHDTQHRMEN